MPLFIRSLLLVITVITGTLFGGQARAEVAYFGLEPDIITNYVSESDKKLGFIRVAIELMLEDTAHLSVAEHHSPLLRATAIDIFGRQPADKIKSLNGREEIRRTVLEELRKLMKKETGSTVIKNVIFTKYLYQGD